MATNWNRTRVIVTFKGNSLINTPDTKHITTAPAMELKLKSEIAFSVITLLILLSKLQSYQWQLQ